MGMATFHIPENEAARDLPGLLARVRAGEEVVIEKEAAPSVILRVEPETRGRLLAESIALSEARPGEIGYEPTLDADFAADLEEIIRNRRPRDTSAWD
jgi:antitoxin (DNA-binding transcriptional repressor) of toxin-antitoxin stability system